MVTRHRYGTEEDIRLFQIPWFQASAARRSQGPSAGDSRILAARASGCSSVNKGQNPHPEVYARACDVMVTPQQPSMPRHCLTWHASPSGRLPVRRRPCHFTAASSQGDRAASATLSSSLVWFEAARSAAKRHAKPRAATRTTAHGHSGDPVLPEASAHEQYDAEQPVPSDAPEGQEAATSTQAPEASASCADAREGAAGAPRERARAADAMDAAAEQAHGPARAPSVHKPFLPKPASLPWPEQGVCASGQHAVGEMLPSPAPSALGIAASAHCRTLPWPKDTATVHTAREPEPSTDEVAPLHDRGVPPVSAPSPQERPPAQQKRPDETPHAPPHACATDLYAKQRTLRWGAAQPAHASRTQRFVLSPTRQRIQAIDDAVLAAQSSPPTLRKLLFRTRSISELTLVISSTLKKSPHTARDTGYVTTAAAHAIVVLARNHRASVVPLPRHVREFTALLVRVFGRVVVLQLQLPRLALLSAMLRALEARHKDVAPIVASVVYATTPFLDHALEAGHLARGTYRAVACVLALAGHFSGRKVPEEWLDKASEVVRIATPTMGSMELAVTLCASSLVALPVLLTPAACFSLL
jgi:hypothetical protein